MVTTVSPKHYFREPDSESEFFRVSKLLTVIVVFGFRRHIVCRMDYEVATRTEQRHRQIEKTPSPAQGLVSVADKIYSIDCLWRCMVVHLASSC